MLDLKRITSEPEQVKAALKNRNNPEINSSIDEILELDTQRKKLLQEVEGLKHQRNQVSQQIPVLKKEGKDTSAIMAEMKSVAQNIKDLDQQLAKVEDLMSSILHVIPNVLHESVPPGKDDKDNIEIRKWGEIREFSFEPKSHFDIGESQGLFNFKKAGEVTGARFVYLLGLGAQLERALVQFMLQTHLDAGYEEMIPPYIVNRDALFGTSQLPKFQEDVFHIEKFDYFLIPTAEVPVTNYHRNEIIDPDKLPLCYTAYTPCFRSEAGSYGKDTRGLKRQHQFHKVELVKFTTPESSFEEHEKLTANAEHILKLLELPYRVVTLCGGDVGFGSTKTYDIEVWSPFAKGYVEISSCSNFLDFQARRANIRTRDKAGKVQFAHTINGSGLAVGRTVLAILENYQNEDGTFSIPEVLKPYLPRR